MQTNINGYQFHPSCHEHQNCVTILHHDFILYTAIPLLLTNGKTNGTILEVLVLFHHPIQNYDSFWSYEMNIIMFCSGYQIYTINIILSIYKHIYTVYMHGYVYINTTVCFYHPKNPYEMNIIIFCLKVLSLHLKQKKRMEEVSSG